MTITSQACSGDRFFVSQFCGLRCFWGRGCRGFALSSEELGKHERGYIYIYIYVYIKSRGIPGRMQREMLGEYQVH